MDEVANTLGSPRGHDEQATYVVVQEPLALNLRGREEGARPELDTLASLRAAEGGSSRSYVLVPSSPVSEGSTPDSPAPDGSTPSSARATDGGGTCSAHGSPECRCTTTYAWSRATTAHGPLGGEKDDERWEQASVVPPLTDHSAGQRVLISSAAGSPARTSQSPDSAEASQAHDPASSTSSPASPGLFDLDGYSSRTYPDCSPRTAVGTSESCLERWPTSGTAWAGGFSTAVSSECRSDAEGCSSSEPSLSMILEPPLSVPARYSLSARAARGIMQRAEKRGRTLPEHLQAALLAVSTTPALEEVS